MTRSEIVSQLNNSAALYYALGLTAFGAKYKAHLFANARAAQFKAFLALWGLPRRVIAWLPGPTVLDKQLLSHLQHYLKAYRDKTIGYDEMSHIALMSFQLPVPNEEFHQILEYIDSMLTSFIEEPISVRSCALQIVGVVEGHCDEYARLVATGERLSPYFSERTPTAQSDRPATH